MRMFMRCLQQTGDRVFHVLSIASIFWIQRSQSQVTSQHSYTVHHVQIPVGFGKFRGFFEKVFGRNCAVTHAFNECNRPAIC